ncbi:MAG: hypothetical protein OSJ69_11985 [Acetatifactor sp.]|nr:hypothetical protein [Acetatifactor sp.]
MLEELDLSETRFKRVAEAFLKKLKTADNGVGFTETEERIDEYLREHGHYNDYGYYYDKYCGNAFGYEVSYERRMADGSWIEKRRERQGRTGAADSIRNDKGICQGNGVDIHRLPESGFAASQRAAAEGRACTPEGIGRPDG